MSLPANITLAHGSGGTAMVELIDGLFKSAFANPWLAEGEDQARLPIDHQPGDRLALTTDSFVISPLQFPGGDIGKLAVCGTLNDLAVGGAKPRYLSAGFIMEEGLPISLLERIVQSMAAEAAANKVSIVTGDTKVVPRGGADQLFINTTGVGVIPADRQLACAGIQPGDALLVNSWVGNHGAAIADVRESLGFESDLHSDCASLVPLIELVLAEFNPSVRCIRDATRGGLAAVANEFAAASKTHLQFTESALPIVDAVGAICELLGFDPLYLANEGNALWVVDAAVKDAVLALMRSHPLGRNAACVGTVLAPHSRGWVTAKNALGTDRMVDLPMGELLPRIC